MIDDKYLELIHQEIDGVNSPQESARLKVYLAQNPKAREFYNELAAMANILDTVESIEPPSHLGNRILNSLNPNRYPAKKKNYFASLLDSINSSMNLKYVYAFSGGLATAVIVYVLFAQFLMTGTPPDSSQIAATIGIEEPQENQTTITQFEIVLKAITGSVHFKRAGDLVVGEFALDAKQPVDVVIAFDEQAVGLKGITFPNAPATNQILMGSGTLKLTYSGKQHSIILFKKRGGSVFKLQMKIRLGHEVIYERAVSVETPNR